MKGPRLRRYHEFGGAKVARERLERLICGSCSGCNEGVVVARYREDRQWIIPEWLGELIVGVVFFSEVKGYVARKELESRVNRHDGLRTVQGDVAFHAPILVLLVSRPC